jgi:hypothetical protein
MLEYFPKGAIQKARVKDCEIIEKDSTSSRIARKVKFDGNGNILRDEFNFFPYSFKGTMRGIYNYQYNSNGRKTKMIGISEEDSKDSVMTIWNYNTQGLLYSKDDYQFSRRLKPGANRHLPNPSDFENYPTWNKKKTDQYSYYHDIVSIKTLIEDNQVDSEKYQLLFDSSKRLKVVKKLEHGSSVETTDYTYEPNNITCYDIRTMSDGSKSMYKSKAVFNDKGWQLIKVLFNDDGSEKGKMMITYNEDGTINSIKHGNSVQEFKYSYY